LLGKVFTLPFYLWKHSIQQTRSL